jgi:hypothetical protein
MRIVHAILAVGLLALAGCSSWPFSWNPLVSVGILAEPANKPTPLGPVKSTVTPKAAWTVAVASRAATPGRLRGHSHLCRRGRRHHHHPRRGRPGVSRIDTKKLSGARRHAGNPDRRLPQGRGVALDLAGKTRWRRMSRAK